MRPKMDYYDGVSQFRESVLVFFFSLRGGRFLTVLRERVPLVGSFYLFVDVYIRCTSFAVSTETLSLSSPRWRAKEAGEEAGRKHAHSMCTTGKQRDFSEK